MKHDYPNVRQRPTGDVTGCGRICHACGQSPLSRVRPTTTNSLPNPWARDVYAGSAGNASQRTS